MSAAIRDKRFKFNESGIPQKYHDLVGTESGFGGHLFGSKKVPDAKYNILGVRFGSSVIYDMKAFKALHPTFQFLLKREGMKKSRWTQGFPLREIKLQEEEL